MTNEEIITKKHELISLAKKIYETGASVFDFNILSVPEELWNAEFIEQVLEANGDLLKVFPDFVQNNKMFVKASIKGILDRKCEEIASVFVKLDDGRKITKELFYKNMYAGLDNKTNTKHTKRQWDRIIKQSQGAELAVIITQVSNEKNKKPFRDEKEFNGFVFETILDKYVETPDPKEYLFEAVKANCDNFERMPASYTF